MLYYIIHKASQVMERVRVLAPEFFRQYWTSEAKNQQAETSEQANNFKDNEAHMKKMR